MSLLSFRSEVIGISFRPPIPTKIDEETRTLGFSGSFDVFFLSRDSWKMSVLTRFSRRMEKFRFLVFSLQNECRCNCSMT